MKKILHNLIYPVILLVVSALPLIANGALRTHSVNVGQFNKIKITDDIDVVYRCVADSTGLAAFTADEKLAKAFIFTNSNGSLRIQINTEMVDMPQLPTVYIYSDYLTGAENGGTGTLHIDSPAPCPEFGVTQMGNGRVIAEHITATTVKGTLATGNGSVILSGKCEEASLRMVGAGSIQADLLEAEDVACTIFGGGTIGCFPERLLKVKGIGTTKVYYKGNPKIKKSGGGKLFPLEESR